MDAQPNSVGRLAHLRYSKMIDLIKFEKVFLTIQNSGAFDQDVLASPVWALARIGTFMVGFRLNLIAYLSGANTIKKEKVCAWAHYLMQNRCERENQYGRSGD
jgi:hypothetical protein